MVNETVYEEVLLHSNLSSEEVEDIINAADEMLERDIRTRVVGGVPAVSEEEAREALLPLIEEGKRLREEIMKEVRKNPTEYPADSVLELANMTEDELAAFSFTVDEWDSHPEIALHSTPQWVTCLEDAFGISEFKKIYKGSAGLLTAKTGLQIAKCFIKRTAGFVSVMYSTYQFATCMK